MKTPKVRSWDAMAHVPRFETMLLGSTPAARPQLAEGEQGVHDRVEGDVDVEQLEPAIGDDARGHSHATDLTTVAAFQCFERPVAMSTSDFTYTACRKMA